jgi:hypothetical protein
VDNLEWHTYNFSTLHTNIKFKTIFKINIVKFLIIHVVIDFNGNHHKNFGMNSKKIMDLQWTFEMTTLCLSHRKNKKC